MQVGTFDLRACVENYLWLVGWSGRCGRLLRHKHGTGHAAGVVLLVAFFRDLVDGQLNSETFKFGVLRVGEPLLRVT